MGMKIKKANIYRAVSTISKPIADSTHTISKIAFYVTEVETEDGKKGQGYLLSFHYSPNAIEGALRDCRDFILDRRYDAFETLRAKREYDCEALKNLIEGNAIDLWQPDLIRLGGVEEWGNSAALAAAF